MHAQAEDGVLLEGRLSEYRELFDSCEVSSDGTIGPSCIMRLCSRVEAVVPEEVVLAKMTKAFPSGDGRVTFSDFLYMFRDNFLDLKQIFRYIALQSTDDQSALAPEEAASSQEVRASVNNFQN